MCILRPASALQRSSLDKHYVRSLFDSIAHRYDLLNHLLSGGVDVYWRRKAIAHLADLHPKTILDVATGTADLAIAAARVHPRRIVGIDLAEEMLKRGREKVTRRGLQHLIELHAGEAENIPFESGTFDAAIVAFGARNFEHLERGLSEMRRVLREGGRIAVLEFSRPTTFPFKQMYFFYFRTVLPVIGRLLSQNREAYTYLPDTVMKFPEGNAFLEILQRVGFVATRQERLTFGIVTIYLGTK